MRLLAVLLLLAAPAWAQEDPPWPQPCVESWTCWLEWDQNAPGEHVVRYEVWSGSTHCADVGGGRAGTLHPENWHNPRNVYWPRPGDNCWEPGHQSVYEVYAVDDEGFVSENPSNSVSFGPQDWACFQEGCEVPCYEAAPLRFPTRPECQP